MALQQSRDLTAPSELPLREVPGSYGWPFLGAIKDRLDYFWFQGAEKFFQSRMDRYKSSVFRANLPPTPPGFRVDPRVVVLLDSRSFSVLFDSAKVDKANTLTGDYMASTDFTGGYRMLAYLDPSEDSHARLKAFLFELLRRTADRWIPDFHVSIAETWETLEKALAEKGKASFNDCVEQCIFSFFCRCLVERDPAAQGPASLGTAGPSHVTKWLAPQVAAVATVGLPQPLEEILLHTFPLPFALVRSDYEKLRSFVETHGASALDTAEQQFGIGRAEAVHNLVFMIGFNAFGGTLIFFPSILRSIAGAGPPLQRQLAREVREAVRANGSLNEKAVAAMALVQSTVYEVLRSNPPVKLQYGRAKADMVVESHRCAYRIKKGELLAGYQPFATRDPQVFHNPAEFVASRFLGEEGQKLLKYLYWSNGPENQETSVHNKQCGGKNLVVLVARLLVAEFFLRYDGFEIDSSNASKVVITSLTVLGVWTEWIISLLLSFGTYFSFSSSSFFFFFFFFVGMQRNDTCLL